MLDKINTKIKQLEAIEKDASGLDVLEDVRSSLAQLRPQAANLSNRLAPISSLPDEILAQVFEECSMGRPMNICLSHVSRHWRRVALGTSYLWSIINISTAHAIELFDFYLMYSRPRRLTVNLTVSDCQEEMQCYSRGIKRSMDLLSHLTILGRDHKDIAALISTFAHHQASSMRTLVLDHIRTDPKSFNQLLSCFPFLDTLRITGSLMFNANQAQGPITLPSLRTLSVDHPFIFYFGELVDAPSVHTVELLNFSFLGILSFLTFLGRSSSPRYPLLQVLKVNTIHPFSRLLSNALPNITHIILDSMGDLNIVLRSLTAQKDCYVAPPTPRVLWPNLRTLTIREGRVSLSEDLLCAMIASRVDVGCPITKLCWESAELVLGNTCMQVLRDQTELDIRLIA